MLLKSMYISCDFGFRIHLFCCTIIVYNHLHHSQAPDTKLNSVNIIDSLIEKSYCSSETRNQLKLGLLHFEEIHYAALSLSITMNGASCLLVFV
ncbi:hypothetical protein WN944_004855 [Citrus x changshan-huyou]|uniref:Uncharacterized protein n=1 Tax=Citrus x changshan-huyou TaxID=2935761 RepID=A0AAP0M1X7_9ROSI